MAQRERSGVWLFFKENNATPELADCTICSKQIRRALPGAPKKKYQTSSLWGHLKSNHQAEFRVATEAREESGNKRKRREEEEAERRRVYVIRSRQETIEQNTERALPYPSNHKQQLEGETLMAYWLCDALKPYTTVANESFVKMITHFNKRFTVPSEKVFRERVVPDLGGKVQYAIKDSLDKNVTGVYAVTTDMWTSGLYDGYISYTAHYITVDWKRKVVILRCMPYSSKHTGDSISVVLNCIKRDWGLAEVHAVVRDNASNITLGVRMSGFDDIGCYTHILHLIVIHVITTQTGVKNMRVRLRTLVKKLKSKNGKKIFLEYQERANVPKNSMILSGETRWKSEYLMFERAEQQKQAIKLAEDDEELSLTVSAKLTPNDWDLIPKVIKLLKPLYTATLTAESDTSCVSDIIPLTKRIKIEIQRVTEIGIGTLKAQLLSEISRYLEGNDTRNNKFRDIELYKITAVATLLDPRYKIAGFTDRDKAQRAKRIILNELQGPAAQEAVVNTPIAQDVNESSLWEDVLVDPFDSRSEESQDEAEQTCPHEKEIAEYLKLARVSVKSDPLMFWKEHEPKFPGLSKLARRYLCPPASSSTSEREFKVSKTLASTRLRLLPTNLENLLFLKYNLRGLNFETQLKPVPTDFDLPNRRTYPLVVDEDGMNSDVDDSDTLYSEEENNDNDDSRSGEGED